MNIHVVYIAGHTVCENRQHVRPFHRRERTGEYVREIGREQTATGNRHMQREIHERRQRLPLRRIEIHNPHIRIDWTHRPNNVGIAPSGIHDHGSVFQQETSIKREMFFVANVHPRPRWCKIRCRQTHAFGNLPR